MVVSFNYINNVVICWCITIICPSLFLIKYLLVCVFLADGLLSCSNVTCFFDIIVFYISTNIVARNAFKNVIFNRVQLISSNVFDWFRNLITKSSFPNSVQLFKNLTLHAIFCLARKLQILNYIFLKFALKPIQTPV